MYDMLLSPMSIGNVEIKNRIVMTSAEFSLGEPSGKVTPRLSDYYEERAKGGVGLIIPGICRVNDMTGAATYTQLSMSHDYHIEPMREMVRKLHSHGAKLAIQLHHEGPSGLTAAKTLAMRGFDVELYEKSEKAGGQVIAASSGSLKERLYWAIEDLMTAAKKEGAKIFLGKELSAAEIKDKKPYAVVCATGGTPLRPRSIPGIEREDVIAAPDLLLGNASVDNSNVVVIGSGMTGLEVTQYLNERGNNVTIVEMAESS
ncbi:MAG: FAD-dependent oxidoreductase [Mogibacterium sp.]|nr:FAD-dependent oxidoreductase [Mogibacterium sp.]